MSHTHWNRLFSHLAHIIYPSCCLSCGKLVFPYERLCTTCLSVIPRVSSPLCIKCGKPLLFLSDTSAEVLCGNCLSIEKVFDSVRSAGLYEPPLREWIHRMKYFNDKRLCQRLGKWMAHTLGSEQTVETVDFVTYVPLNRTKRRIREYDQAECLAIEVCRMYDLPLMHCLYRKDDTMSQARLSAQKRREHVKNLYSIRKNMRSVVRNRTILLIDDVHTTGATLHACSHVLKKVGAYHVYCWTLATTIPVV